MMLARSRPVLVEATRNERWGGWNVRYGDIDHVEWLSDTEFDRRFEPVSHSDHWR